MYVPLPRFLLRAPLLPAAALGRGARALLRHRAGARRRRARQPVAGGAQAGAAAGSGARALRAARRVPAHAARLARGRVHGDARGADRGRDRRAGRRLTPSWARIEALARAAARRPGAARAHAAARRAVGVARRQRRPLARARRSVRRGARGGARRAAARHPRRRRSAGRRGPTCARPRGARRRRRRDADELLLTLLDDGLLQSDLAPPIIGPAPGEHLRARLAALGEHDAARALDQANAALATRRPRARHGGAGLAPRAAAATPTSTPCWSTGPRRRPRSSAPRSSAPPGWRRCWCACRTRSPRRRPSASRSRRSPTALDAVTELYGGGAFDVAALATGDYGVELRTTRTTARRRTAPARPPRHGGADPAARRDRGGGRARRDEATLDPAGADRRRCATSPARACRAAPSCSWPRCRAGRASRPGHGLAAGPARARRRLAGPLRPRAGREALAAIAALEAAERRARPLEIAVDVAFAPTPALTDLAARPQDVAPHARALALERRDADDGATRARARRARSGRRSRRAGRARAARARDRRARSSRRRSPACARAPRPRGSPRLLVGWSLWRQHASWALPLGPLAELAFIPRLCLDGFVIAPASWRAAARPAHARRHPALAAGRRRCRATCSSARVTSCCPSTSRRPGPPPIWATTDRVFEIWPPLDDSSIATGGAWRRWSCSSSSQTPTTSPSHARRSEAIRAAGAVPPPAPRARDWSGWRTFKLFGAQGRQDDLLALAASHRPRRPARRRDRSLVLPALHRRAGPPPPPARPRARAGDAARARSKAGCATAFRPRAPRRW